ncbi:MAG: LptA/OstA family protein [Desulfomonilaceae bacterium]
MKGFSIKISIVVLILALALLPQVANTENGQVISGKSSEGTVDVASKKVIIRPCSEGRETIFEGDVKAKQRDITLFCDRLIIISNENKGSTAPESRTKKLSKDLQISSEVKTITALGNVKITQKDRTVTAGKAIYDHAKRTVTLSEGPPRFWQGRDSGMADAVIMYLDENRFELFKPNFTIDPGEQKKEIKK